MYLLCSELLLSNILVVTLSTRPVLCTCVYRIFSGQRLSLTKHAIAYAKLLFPPIT